MIQSAKRQFAELNWLHVALSVVLTAGLVAGMLGTVAWTFVEDRGDERWASKVAVDKKTDAMKNAMLTRSEIVQVVTNSVTSEIEAHEKNERYHPAPSGVASYVRRHEVESLEDRIERRMSRMEDNLISEIRAIRDNQNNTE